MDPYKVLGLNQGATKEEAKKAWKDLAQKWHPDKNNGSKESEEKFKEINAAYDLIKNDEVNQNSFHNLNDLFNQHFGFQNFNGTRVKRKIKRTARIGVSLEDAFNGCKKTIRMENTSPCEKCIQGLIFGDKPCVNCKGVGELIVDKGFIKMRTTCPYCRGVGKQINGKCKECGGSGVNVKVNEIEISIPSGTAYGQTISATEDVDIIIMFNQHKEFHLMENGADLLSVVNISLFDALLGNTIEINTLSGKKNLKVASGTQPNSIMRIKDGGMKDVYGRWGDHLIEIKIELPKSLNEEQMELINKLKESFKN